MPVNLPDQNWTVPIGADVADNPQAFVDFAADVQGTVVLRYPNTATRDSFDGSRVAGDVSFTTGNTWYERWTGAKWIPCTPIQAVKTADQIVNNSTVLVNDTHLVVPLPAANTTYAIELVALYVSGTTGDIKFTLTGPAGSAGTLGGAGLATAAAGPGFTEGRFAATGIPGGLLGFGGAGGAIALTALLQGAITTAGTTGSLQLQWAQDALEAANTTLLIRSRLCIEAIS